MTDDAIKTLANLDLNSPNAKAIMAKICVPSASDGTSGAQIGVEKPWKQQYPSSKGKKKISGDEAIKRYRQKLASGAPAYPVEHPDATIGESGPDDLDPFVDSEPVKEDKPEKPARKRTVKKAAGNDLASLIYKLKELIAGNEDVKLEKSTLDIEYARSELANYKARKESVKIKVSTGMITMPCLSVIQEEYGVTVVLDANASNFVFVPESGTEVTLSWGGKSVKAYFPGAQFTIPELGLCGLVFLADPGEEPSKPVETPVKKEENGVVPAPQFKFNPESGLEEDEFGLTRV